MTPRYAARVYTMTATIYSKKSACRLGFRLINFLITNSSEWERVSDWCGRRHFIDRLQNFWCDWWPARGKEKRRGEERKDEEARGTIAIIINFTDTIGYIVYIYSVLLATRRSYLPSRHWVGELGGGGKRREVVRDTGRKGEALCVYKSRKQRWYAILKYKVD